MKHFSSPRPRPNDFNLFLAKENCFNEKQTESILEELHDDNLSQLLLCPRFAFA